MDCVAAKRQRTSSQSGHQVVPPLVSRRYRSAASVEGILGREAEAANVLPHVARKLAGFLKGGARLQVKAE